MYSLNPQQSYEICITSILHIGKLRLLIQGPTDSERCKAKLFSKAYVLKHHTVKGQTWGR